MGIPCLLSQPFAEIREILSTDCIPTLALSKSGKVEGICPSSQPSFESSLAHFSIARRAYSVKLDRIPLSAGGKGGRFTGAGNDDSNPVRHADGHIHVPGQPACVDANLIGTIGVTHPDGMILYLEHQIHPGLLQQGDFIRRFVEAQIDDQ